MYRWSTPGEAHAYETGYIEGRADARQWIPVTKRLPDSDDVVLTCYKDGSISTNWFGVYDNIREWVYDKEHIVAWMPLPEPWEGGAEECH